MPPYPIGGYEMSWFENFKEEVLAYLDKATKDEIIEGLERANYAFYKNIDYPTLDLHDLSISCESLGIDTFKQSLKNKFLLSFRDSTKRHISFREMGVAIADFYNYALAA
jgi:hypothetical protein